MSEPRLHVVLYNPEIPPNTGNVGRLCVGIGARLHVVHPIGFSMDQRQVRRAGLDYWKHVDLVEHEDGDAFWAWAEGRRLHLYSSHGTATYASVTHEPGDVLVFGRESVGLPKDIIAKHGALTIPMDGPTRSLNLSNAVAIVVYNALQTVAPALF
ncbi:MAG: tRNA (cytidine/uridine-2'-O-)-methyltransferase [Myxococcota bacterium]|jgi:tRNA (cytidine/uridine-2'-O-)-methyltransferase